jgi:hypothetical protein
MSRRFVVESSAASSRGRLPAQLQRPGSERPSPRAGRYAWCENARVLHRHWLFGDRPQDATDTRLLGEHPERAGVRAA